MLKYSAAHSNFLSSKIRIYYTYRIVFYQSGISRYSKGFFEYTRNYREVRKNINYEWMKGLKNELNLLPI